MFLRKLPPPLPVLELLLGAGVLPEGPKEEVRGRAYGGDGFCGVGEEAVSIAEGTGGRDDGAIGGYPDC